MMYVVLEALQAGQHKIIYYGVLQVRKMRYYFKIYSYPEVLAPEHTSPDRHQESRARDWDTRSSLPEPRAAVPAFLVFVLCWDPTLSSYSRDLCRVCTDLPRVGTHPYRQASDQ